MRIGEIFSKLWKVSKFCFSVRMEFEPCETSIAVRCQTSVSRGVLVLCRWHISCIFLSSVAMKFCRCWTLFIYLSCFFYYFYLFIYLFIYLFKTVTVKRKNCNTRIIVDLFYQRRHRGPL